MAAPLKRSRRPTAIPLGMAMATALLVVPDITASAVESTGSAASAGLSHVVTDALDAVTR
ncbi:hypothetical protein ACFZAE_16795 [Streptomyces scabiei]|uniref:hypothetical protein n=1 Tax=Streptomyces TaxID=1883 RepID=UPI001BFF4022|nr:MULTISPECIES: hypothetical protein [unclassified Streptomyces]